ncbi:DUF58 domain-containing protein [Solirubrobacter sp. CPCC 204708]|nr:DUF58 domain-containing protein [Solirubrobacter deserti]
MSPAPRAVVVLAALALSALILPIGVVVLLALALVGAVIVDARAARRAPTVTRQAPEVLSRGISAPFGITATPAAGGTVVTRQPVPANVRIEPDSITALRRGRHVLPPVASRSTGPLKLARWDHAATGEAEVRVFPDLHTARRLALAVARGRFRDQGNVARGPLGLGTEFELIRDYVPDDDVRQVNWRATARMGRPMSNQYRLEQDRDLILLIDAGRLSTAPLAEATILDAELDAASALAFVADELGDRTGAVAFDDDVRVALTPQRKGGQVVVRALFDLEAAPVDSDFELAFRRAEANKRALVVVLCDLLEEAAARPLVRAVPVLTRRHHVVVASPSDPALEAIANQEGEDRLARPRATVARDVLAGRARAAAQVRAAGARVIEAPPDRLPATLVATYLRAKSRAIL